MEKIVHTVGCLIYRDDEILLVRHGVAATHLTNVYGLPAGRPLENESDRTACIRELSEETGLIANRDDLIELPKKYVAKIKRKDGVKTFSIRIYLAKLYSGKLKATAEAHPEWVKISELKNYNLLPNIEKIVNDGLKYK